MTDLALALENIKTAQDLLHEQWIAGEVSQEEYKDAASGLMMEKDCFLIDGDK